MPLSKLLNVVHVYAQRREGQTMTEYGVVLAVITLATLFALAAIAATVSGKLGVVTGILDAVK
jgi:Flp pilus assembly pilin Flp